MVWGACSDMEPAPALKRRAMVGSDPEFRAAFRSLPPEFRAELTEVGMDDPSVWDALLDEGVVDVEAELIAIVKNFARLPLAVM